MGVGVLVGRGWSKYFFTINPNLKYFFFFGGGGGGGI